jgi:hypothetical protein
MMNLTKTLTAAALMTLLVCSTAEASPAFRMCDSKRAYAAAILGAPLIAVVKVVENSSSATRMHSQPATRYKVILEVVRAVRGTVKAKRRITIEALVRSGYPGAPRFPATGKTTLAFLSKGKKGQLFARRPAFGAPGCPAPSVITKVNKAHPGLLAKVIKLDKKLRAMK